MAYTTPAKLFAKTQGRSLVCLCYSLSGKLGLAVSDEALRINAKDLKQELTADALKSLVNTTKARGVLIGGFGAFRADGRSQFGCRQIVSLLNPPFIDEKDAFPVAFWRQGDTESPQNLLHSFLKDGRKNLIKHETEIDV